MLENVPKACSSWLPWEGRGTSGPCNMMMMMIAFIILKSGLVPLIEGLTLKSYILDLRLSVGWIHIFFERKIRLKEKAGSPRKHSRTHKKQGPDTRIHSTLYSDHTVRRFDKICTHTWKCHHFRVWTPSRMGMQPKTYMTKRREHVHKALPRIPACTTRSISRGPSLSFHRTTTTCVTPDVHPGSLLSQVTLSRTGPCHERGFVVHVNVAAFE